MNGRLKDLEITNFPIYVVSIKNPVKTNKWIN